MRGTQSPVAISAGGAVVQLSMGTALVAPVDSSAVAISSSRIPVHGFLLRTISALYSEFSAPVIALSHESPLDPAKVAAWATASRSL